MNSQTSRSLKSSVPHLEPRIELRPQHRRVSEQVVSNAGASHPSKAGLATSSGSGSSAKSAPNDVDRNREAFGWQNTKDKDAAGGPELNLDDEDEDFGKQLRPSDDFASFKDMLDSDPPWLAPSDPPAPSDLSAPSAQSQSKIKGLVSFSMKKSASGTAKKRATGSSINVKQIGEPSMLYSSASIAGSQTEPLPGGARNTFRLCMLIVKLMRLHIVIISSPQAQHWIGFSRNHSFDIHVIRVNPHWTLGRAKDRCLARSQRMPKLSDAGSNQSLLNSRERMTCYWDFSKLNLSLLRRP